MEAEIQSFLGVVLCIMLAGLFIFGVCVIVAGSLFSALKWRHGKVFLEVVDYNKPQPSAWDYVGEVRVRRQIGIIKNTIWYMGFDDKDNDKDSTISHARVILSIYKHTLRNKIKGVDIGQDVDILNTSIFHNKVFVGRVHHNDNRALTCRVNEVIENLQTSKNKETKVILDKEYINNKTYRDEKKEY